MENRFKQQFVSLTLVWTAILISYCLLTGIIFYIAKSGEASPDKTLNAVYSYISIFSIMALIPASYYIYGVFAKKRNFSSE